MAEEEKVVDPVDDPASVGAGTDPVGDAGTGVAEEKPFFTFKDKGGAETVYKNAGELATHMTHSSMRRDEFDTAMGKVTQRTKELDARQAEYDKQKAELDGSDDLRYLKTARDLRQTNPQRYARLKAEYDAIQEPPSSDIRTVVEDVVTKMVKPLSDKQAGYDKAEEARAADGRRDAAASRMTENYPGFTKELVQAELKRIQDIPPADMEYALYEMMWDVVRGRSNSAELERRTAVAAARPKMPSVKSTPGVKPTGRNPNDMTAAERREEAERLLSG